VGKGNNVLFIIKRLIEQFSAMGVLAETYRHWLKYISFVRAEGEEKYCR
jgi:hypothetical protein